VFYAFIWDLCALSCFHELSQSLHLRVFFIKGNVTIIAMPTIANAMPRGGKSRINHIEKLIRPKPTRNVFALLPICFTFLEPHRGHGSHSITIKQLLFAEILHGTWFSCFLNNFCYYLAAFFNSPPISVIGFGRCVINFAYPSSHLMRFRL